MKLESVFMFNLVYFAWKVKWFILLIGNFGSLGIVNLNGDKNQFAKHILSFQGIEILFFLPVSFISEKERGREGQREGAEWLVQDCCYSTQSACW